LLKEAAAAADTVQVIATCFAQVDLLSPGWPAAIDLECGAHAERASSRSGWPAIACLAVLHHLPGEAERSRFLAEAAALLAPGGTLVISTWQFMTSARLRQRILPWETVGLHNEDVDPGDYLMAWGEGAAGQRYCAFIDQEALDRLAVEAGLSPVAVFHADGYEGNLNLYGVYERNDVNACRS
jgi:hypothetical protein